MPSLTACAMFGECTWEACSFYGTTEEEQMGTWREEEGEERKEGILRSGYNI